MYKTFYYAIGESWIVSMYGSRATYTVKKAEYRVRDGKEIYTVDVDGKDFEFTKNRLHYLIHCAGFKKLKSGTRTRYKVPEPPAEIVRAYYALLRQREEIRTERIKETLERDERYSKIRQEISEYSRDAAKAEFQGADILTIRKLNAQLNAAKRERDAIIAAHGYKLEDLQRRLNCKACEDTGYLPNGKLCACIEKNLTGIMDHWEKAENEKQRRKAR